MYLATKPPFRSRMAKKLKLQQERAVIPAENNGLGAKTVTSGENARQSTASTSGAEPDMTVKRAMTGAPAIASGRHSPGC
jgi:hypothetical protein